MKLQRHSVGIFNQLLSLFLLITLFNTAVSASDIDGPQLSEPLQKKKFFEPERFSFIASPDTAKSALEPYLSVSRDAREENVGLGANQVYERVHGEAGGKLNLLGDISLTTFAKIPVYAKDTVENQKNSGGVSTSELFKTSGRFSWRSELGVPVKKGVDLNFFYDNSNVGKIDKPGVEEREEKFGTRFIFKFE